ncbi:MAG: hypothetical protein BWZ08_02497 [candidate division BRC1 bacterium ADurb.BinA292]|nr:MAG: hypothetical protein BWZ08_02497 [candidate division BRC1 bacterium ADurb.BinA292]
MEFGALAADLGQIMAGDGQFVLRLIALLAERGDGRARLGQLLLVVIALLGEGLLRHRQVFAQALQLACQRMKLDGQFLDFMLAHGELLHQFDEPAFLRLDFVFQDLDRVFLDGEAFAQLGDLNLQLLTRSALRFELALALDDFLFLIGQRFGEAGDHPVLRLELALHDGEGGLAARRRGEIARLARDDAAERQQQIALVGGDDVVVIEIPEKPGELLVLRHAPDEIFGVAAIDPGFGEDLEAGLLEERFERLVEVFLAPFPLAVPAHELAKGAIEDTLAVGDEGHHVVAAAGGHFAEGGDGALLLVVLQDAGVPDAVEARQAEGLHVEEIALEEFAGEPVACEGAAAGFEGDLAEVEQRGLVAVFGEDGAQMAGAGAGLEQVAVGAEMRGEDGGDFGRQQAIDVVDLGVVFFGDRVPPRAVLHQVNIQHAYPPYPRTGTRGRGSVPPATDPIRFHLD